MTPDFVIRTGCLLVAMAGSGCSSHASYPLAWPAVPQTAQRTCEQLVGTYRDRGIYGTVFYGTVPSPQSLTELLLGPNGRTWRAESVTLSFPRVGQIQIGVSGPGTQSSSTIFTAEEGRFVCQTGLVMVRRPARWSFGGAGAPGLGRETETLELFSVDDYLVVKQKQRIFILAGFVLPLGGRETHWYRFERATRVPEGKTESTRGVNRRGGPPDRPLHPSHAAPARARSASAPAVETSAGRRPGRRSSSCAVPLQRSWPRR